MPKPAIAHASESGTPTFSMWQLLGFLAGPLLFLFVYTLVRPDGLPLTATAVLASTALMITWGVTRAVPPLVTGLLPLVLFPVLGIATLTDAAARYADPTIVLLLGVCLVALAGERWQLFRRLALAVTALSGAQRSHKVIAIGRAARWRGSRQELAAMGPLSPQEKRTLAVLAGMVILWLIRPYLIAPYLPLVDDATIAMLGALLLFLVPADLAKGQWLLTADMLPKVPWSLLVLIGAGLATAGAAQSSGLWQWMAGSLPLNLAGIGSVAVRVIAFAAVGISLTRTRT